MKLLIRIFVTLLLLFSSLTSCVNVKNKKAIKDFQLNIILTDKIGQSPQDKLPEDIIRMVMPLEPAGCPKVAYLPKVEIIRYGLNKGYSVKLNTDAMNWRIFFQKFYGNTGVETRKSNINKAMEKFSIGDTLSKVNSENVNSSQFFEKITNSGTEDKYLIFKKGFNGTKYTITSGELPVFTNIDTLLYELGKLLCESTSEPNKKLVILYDPAILAGTIVTTIDSTLNATSIDSTAKKPSDNLTQGSVIHHDRVIHESSGSDMKKQMTLPFPNGDVYVGEVSNNKPNGIGTKTFKNNCQISQLDPEKHMAEAGDYLVGVWRNGEPQICKLYNASKTYKYTITIGE